jgi:uncharacterized RDD family membrane protein YckC
VDYEDRIRIATPEGVDVELLLGGAGSRFTAATVDYVIQLALWGFCAALFMLGVGGGVGAALLAIATFLIFFVYDVAFEVWAGGRTPGKRWNGLRVVLADGRPVTFTRSALRNVLRPIDVLFFGIGAVFIVVTERNQRIGDLVADTLVVRELQAPSAYTQVTAEPRISVTVPSAPLPVWDVSAVTGEELAAVRSFLLRRKEITFDARHQIATMLASKLRPKVVGAQDDLRDEPFLETLAQLKAARL